MDIPWNFADGSHRSCFEWFNLQFGVCSAWNWHISLDLYSFGCAMAALQKSQDTTTHSQPELLLIKPMSDEGAASPQQRCVEWWLANAPAQHEKYPEDFWRKTIDRSADVFSRLCSGQQGSSWTMQTASSTYGLKIKRQPRSGLPSSLAPEALDPTSPCSRDHSLLTFVEWRSRTSGPDLPQIATQWRMDMKLPFSDLARRSGKKHEQAES